MEYSTPDTESSLLHVFGLNYHNAPLLGYEACVRKRRCTSHKVGNMEDPMHGRECRTCKTPFVERPVCRNPACPLIRIDQDLISSQEDEKVLRAYIQEYLRDSDDEDRQTPIDPLASVRASLTPPDLHDADDDGDEKTRPDGIAYASVAKRRYSVSHAPPPEPQAHSAIPVTYSSVLPEPGRGPSSLPPPHRSGMYPAGCRNDLATQEDDDEREIPTPRINRQK